MTPEPGVALPKRAALPGRASEATEAGWAEAAAAAAADVAGYAWDSATPDPKGAEGAAENAQGLEDVVGSAEVACCSLFCSEALEPAGVA